MQEWAGQILDGKYRLVRLIGRGGMGGVFEAEHLALRRRVAVKMILPELTGYGEAQERFRLEAQAAGRLYHPNVVAVTDYGIAPIGDASVAYIVMEYVPGKNLRQLLAEEGRLPLASALDVVEQIALALRAAHDAGILHRDLKPDNVAVVPDGRGGYVVKVIDFGIASLLAGETEEMPNPEPFSAPSTAGETPTIRLDRDAASGVTGSAPPVEPDSERTLPRTPQSLGRLTTAGSIVGTPAYMSPEQLRGEVIDHRSDIYALALVAFEILGGRRPFEGAARDVVRQQLEETPLRLDAVASDLPKTVADVVAQSLAKDRQRRHGSTTAFAGSLRAAAEGPSLVLRRAISIYSERLDSLLRLSLDEMRPLLIASVLVLVGIVVVTARPLEFVYAYGVFVLLSLVVGILWTWSTMTSHALFALALAHIHERPLLSVSRERIVRELEQIIGLPEGSSFVRRSWHLIRFYFRCERRAPLGAGDLSFVVAALERLDPSDAGERCRRLVPAVERAYVWIRASIILATIVVPAAEAVVAYTVLGAAHVALSRELALLAGIALIPLNVFWMMPVFSLAFGLLYYRARQANGEDISAAPPAVGEPGVIAASAAES